MQSTRPRVRHLGELSFHFSMTQQTRDRLSPNRRWENLIKVLIGKWWDLIGAHFFPVKSRDDNDRLLADDNPWSTNMLVCSPGTIHRSRYCDYDFSRKERKEALYLSCAKPMALSKVLPDSQSRTEPPFNPLSYSRSLSFVTLGEPLSVSSLISAAYSAIPLLFSRTSFFVSTLSTSHPQRFFYLIHHIYFIQCLIY